MDVPRVVFVAALVFAMPISEAQVTAADAEQSVRAPGPHKPWKHVRGFGRVLNLSKPPVVIDEPGLYAVDRSWRFTAATMDAAAELITITAPDVTLDLHGFTISAEDSPAPTSTLLILTGDDAEVRNGGIETSDIDVAVRSAGRGAWLHHLVIRTGDSNPELHFAAFTTISDSKILGLIHLVGDSTLEQNSLVTAHGAPATVLRGDENRVIGNRISAGNSDVVVHIVGNANIVANNVMGAGGFVGEGYRVDGDRNVLRENTVFADPGLVTFIRISGTGNTLDGNMAAPAYDFDGKARIGIEFTTDGNYYGNNRVSAEVPFALGGTVQTDWGSNVGY
jgi:hypothetical protein